MRLHCGLPVQVHMDVGKRQTSSNPDTWGWCASGSPMRLSMADAGCNGPVSPRHRGPPGGAAQTGNTRCLRWCGVHCCACGVPLRSPTDRRRRPKTSPQPAIPRSPWTSPLSGPKPVRRILAGCDRCRGHEVIHQVDFSVEDRLHHGIHGRVSLGVTCHDDAEFLVDVHRFL